MFSFLHRVEFTSFCSQSSSRWIHRKNERGERRPFSLGWNFAFSGCQARCWEEIYVCKLASLSADQQMITKKKEVPVCTCHCGDGISIHRAHRTTCWRLRQRGQSLDALPQRRVWRAPWVELCRVRSILKATLFEERKRKVGFRQRWRDTLPRVESTRGGDITVVASHFSSCWPNLWVQGTTS